MLMFPFLLFLSHAWLPSVASLWGNVVLWNGVYTDRAGLAPRFPPASSPLRYRPGRLRFDAAMFVLGLSSSIPLFAHFPLQSRSQQASKCPRRLLLLDSRTWSYMGHHSQRSKMYAVVYADQLETMTEAASLQFGVGDVDKQGCNHLYKLQFVSVHVTLPHSQ